MMTPPPLLVMVFAVSLPRTSLRTAMTTWASSAAKSMVMARPMPQLPPVTSATLSSSFTIPSPRHPL